MKSRPYSPGRPILASDGNDRRDDARASSFLLSHQMLGTLALGTQPADGDIVTVTVNGNAIVLTAKTTLGSVADQVLIGGSALAFATNVLNHLRRPDLTTSTAIASSSANQALLNYVGWAWPASSTNIVPFSLDKNVNGITDALTSFSASTTTSGNTWTAGTLKLYVEDGTYYINGTRYLFTGGSTPAVTAPSSHPRIDVLTIDTSGTLAWTTGTENASPVAPAYPANKLAICELYNVVSETALYDAENQQSGQGYISNDVRPAVSAGPTLGAIPDDLIPNATNTRSLGSSSYQWTNIYGEFIYQNGALVAASKFGGTGANGALSITSGATNINLGNAAVYVLNYTSISITGTGYLTFTNPNANGTIVIMKSQGNVTVTTSATSAIVLVGNGSSSGYGNGLIAGPRSAISTTVYGNVIVSGGSQVANFIPGFGVNNANTINGKGVNVFAGAVGTNGGSGTGSSSGSGGAGGGGLYIECGGALNFTATISANGSAGGNGSGSNTFNTLSNAGDGGGSNGDGTLGSHYVTISSGQAGAGGGGGGGGSVCILYNTLTANSGTITVAGGAGGTGGSSVAGGAGGAGWSLVALNTEFS